MNDELIQSDFTAASYGLLSGAARFILFPRVPNLPMVRALGELGVVTEEFAAKICKVVNYLVETLNPVFASNLKPPFLMKTFYIKLCGCCALQN